MITEDYISFETAKLLKEKGFDEPCYEIYKIIANKPRVYHNPNEATNSDLNEIYANIEFGTLPTLQMAMKWLREVHNYDISICLDSYVEPYDNEYYIVIRRRKDRFEEVSPCEQVYFKTYEEACEAAIKYCLENLI